ncbi:transmembrane protein, putative [Medicago truncatula]|uniref:Transmembrane protein, putative n=1 Tax=Medicago truncatula TaxID=3880 RepID=A0A072U1B6_MEDTR|nr:transmembrane protein, putative [Medicago truncatula]
MKETYERELVKKKKNETGPETEICKRRRNDKVIINSHISGGNGVRTLVIASGLIISAFCQLNYHF